MHAHESHVSLYSVHTFTKAQGQKQGECDLVQHSKAQTQNIRSHLACTVNVAPSFPANKKGTPVCVCMCVCLCV